MRATSRPRWAAARARRACASSTSSSAAPSATSSCPAGSLSRSATSAGSAGWRQVRPRHARRPHPPASADPFAPRVFAVLPENIVVNQLFGSISGLGMGLLTFDWSQIAYIGSPLITPWWAAANVAVAFVVGYWIVVPALYYSNVSLPAPAKSAVPVHKADGWRTPSSFSLHRRSRPSTCRSCRAAASTALASRTTTRASSAPTTASTQRRTWPTRRCTSRPRSRSPTCSRWRSASPRSSIPASSTVRASSRASAAARSRTTTSTPGSCVSTRTCRSGQCPPASS